MSEKNYQSPNGPGLNIDDFHPSTEVRGDSPGAMGAQYMQNRAMHAKNNPMRLSGGVVGHQQYGNWQEHN